MSNLPLYWRVCVINGSVFLLAALVLIVSPATKSTAPTASEVLVLVSGVTVIAVLNALLIRSSLAPIDRLTDQMKDVNLEAPGQQLVVTGDQTARALVQAFNDLLARVEQERRTSSARALAAQEAERQRIARELHDEIGQGLTAVLLGVRRAINQGPAETAEELQIAQDAARSSLAEVRRLVRRLRPEVLEDLGLVSALGALAADFATHTGVDVHRILTRALPPLSAEAELVIYRVAQEALTNAARHSGADAVELALLRDADAVILRVADNGRGRQARREGAGLQGMRERTALVGARLAVRDRSGGGTEVELTVPELDAVTGVQP